MTTVPRVDPLFVYVLKLLGYCYATDSDHPVFKTLICGGWLDSFASFLGFNGATNTMYYFDLSVSPPIRLAISDDDQLALQIPWSYAQFYRETKGTMPTKDDWWKLTASDIIASNVCPDFPRLVSRGGKRVSPISTLESFIDMINKHVFKLFLPHFFDVLIAGGYSTLDDITSVTEEEVYDLQRLSESMVPSSLDPRPLLFGDLLRTISTYKVYLNFRLGRQIFEENWMVVEKATLDDFLKFDLEQIYDFGENSKPMGTPACVPHNPPRFGHALPPNCSTTFAGKATSPTMNSCDPCVQVKPQRPSDDVDWRDVAYDKRSTSTSPEISPVSFGGSISGTIDDIEPNKGTGDTASSCETTFACDNDAGAYDVSEAMKPFVESPATSPNLAVITRETTTVNLLAPCRSPKWLSRYRRGCPPNYLHASRDPTIDPSVNPGVPYVHTDPQEASDGVSMRDKVINWRSMSRKRKLSPVSFEAPSTASDNDPVPTLDINVTARRSATTLLLTTDDTYTTISNVIETFIGPPDLNPALFFESRENRVICEGAPNCSPDNFPNDSSDSRFTMMTPTNQDGSTTTVSFDSSKIPVLISAKIWTVFLGLIQQFVIFGVTPLPRVVNLRVTFVDASANCHLPGSDWPDILKTSDDGNSTCHAAPRPPAEPPPSPHAAHLSFPGDFVADLMITGLTPQATKFFAPPQKSPKLDADLRSPEFSGSTLPAYDYCNQRLHQYLRLRIYGETTSDGVWIPHALIDGELSSRIRLYVGTGIPLYALSGSLRLKADSEDLNQVMSNLRFFVRCTTLSLRVVCSKIDSTATNRCIQFTPKRYDNAPATVSAPKVPQVQIDISSAEYRICGYFKHSLSQCSMFYGMNSVIGISRDLTTGGLSPGILYGSPKSINPPIMLEFPRNGSDANPASTAVQARFRQSTLAFPMSGKYRKAMKASKVVPDESMVFVGDAISGPRFIRSQRARNPAPRKSDYGEILYPLTDGRSFVPTVDGETVPTDERTVPCPVHGDYVYNYRTSSTTPRLEILRSSDCRLPPVPYGVVPRTADTDSILFPDHWNDYHYGDCPAYGYIEGNHRGNETHMTVILPSNATSIPMKVYHVYFDPQWVSGEIMLKESSLLQCVEVLLTISLVDDNPQSRSFDTTPVYDNVLRLFDEFGVSWTINHEAMIENIAAGALSLKDANDITIRFHRREKVSLGLRTTWSTFVILESGYQVRSMGSYSVICSDMSRDNGGEPPNAPATLTLFPPKLLGDSGDQLQLDVLKDVRCVSSIQPHVYDPWIHRIVFGAFHWKRTRFRVALMPFPWKHTRFRDKQRNLDFATVTIKVIDRCESEQVNMPLDVLGIYSDLTVQRMVSYLLSRGMHACGSDLTGRLLWNVRVKMYVASDGESEGTCLTCGDIHDDEMNSMFIKVGEYQLSGNSFPEHTYLP